jgi:hypothetical protein
MKALVRLIYRSRVAPGFQSEQLNDIMRAARQYNGPAGITGLLVFNARHFMQVLEGPLAAVCARYHRIATDPRHCDMLLLHFAEIDARRFEDWSMGFLGLDERTARVLMKYTVDGTVDEPPSSEGMLELMTQLGCELRARRYLHNVDPQAVHA